jgi:Ser/Thr protein kinase RdoA (MazF antagonist)
MARTQAAETPDMERLNETPYQDLTPDTVLDAIESAGWPCNGHQLPLNSYENRVFQIGLADDGFIVAKFYRPGRWSDAQIREEHAFLLELLDHELPVVAPLSNEGGETLFWHGNFRFALFPRQGGHAPNIESEDNLVTFGRMLGRIHRVGAARPFEHRPAISVERLGVESRDFLLASDFVPAELRDAYASITAHLLERLGPLAIPRTGRIHGDCHLGNVLWRDAAPHFVDFDDAVNGPAVQDLWMLLSGTRDEQCRQLSLFLGGYDEFHTFNTAQLALIEPLRTLRIMYHAAWIARRWHDPAFPHAFTWFGTVRYWSDHVLALREQLAALDEPPLDV